MRIGVLRTQVPFVTGGAERHAANLVTALRRHGHAATEITLPFKWYPSEVLTDHILAAKLTDVSEVDGVPIDLTIGLKFPAYLAQHPNRLFWILHQHRQAYDMWDAGISDLLDDPDGGAVRQAIWQEDRTAFQASPHPIYANSGNVAARLKGALDIPATPLYHPPPQAELITPGPAGGYLFAPGRLNPLKRMDLVLRALAQAGGSIPLKVAGVAENPAYQDELFALADTLGVSGQVTWLGAVSDDDLRRHYAEARAVVFAPQDEDYGYITLEAMLAAKPVITTTDAGGPLEFIRDGQEGCITAPDPDALARAFDRFMQDGALAERLGQAGLARYQSFSISWDHVVETLVGSTSAAAAAPIPIELEPTPAPLPEPSAPAGPMPPEDEAVAALLAAIEPPAPPDLPFASITEVLEAFAFEALPARLGISDPPVDPGLAGYLGTHWTRFLTTLSVLEGLELTRALDVGVFPPLVFQALLACRHPGVEMAGLWEGPNPYQQHVVARRDGLPSFEITLSPANSERDRWPFEDGCFDLVSGMEILEHLALDPHFFFSEANRVLAPGGHLLLTTPNVVSHRGVSKVLAGIAPYSFGIFVPSGGVYGRHNREYAPPELARLGEAAGFETVQLTTYDVYDRHVDPSAAQLLQARDDDLSLRGENIVYLAKKTGPAGEAPPLFYHGDPIRMAGAVHVAEFEPQTGLYQLQVDNRSTAWWPASGDRATGFLLEWSDADGVMRHQHLLEALPGPLGPGQGVRVPLRLDVDGAREPRGQIRLHLFQMGVGVMSGSGRADPLVLPASEAAFLDVVRLTRQEGQEGGMG